MSAPVHECCPRARERLTWESSDGWGRYFGRYQFAFDCGDGSGSYNSHLVPISFCPFCGECLDPEEGE